MNIWQCVAVNCNNSLSQQGLSVLSGGAHIPCDMYFKGYFQTTCPFSKGLCAAVLARLAAEGKACALPVCCLELTERRKGE